MPITLWQLYDTVGSPLVGRGATLWDCSANTLLHGAAHVWLWRPTVHGIEVLVQIRSERKLNWPGKLNKSAGGHILFGEDPVQAAIRKLRIELGLKVKNTDLEFIGRHHWRAVIDGSGFNENEQQWIYIMRYDKDNFDHSADEVGGVVWKPLNTFKAESVSIDTYVPYGLAYYEMVYEALKCQAS